SAARSASACGRILMNRKWALFFFSSRRRHTSSYGDWSSDVCSSDLSRLLSFLGILLELRQQRQGLDRRHAIDVERRHAAPDRVEIGRASCRERVEKLVVASTVNKKRGPRGFNS